MLDRDPNRFNRAEHNSAAPTRDAMRSHNSGFRLPPPPGIRASPGPNRRTGGTDPRIWHASMFVEVIDHFFQVHRNNSILSDYLPDQALEAIETTKL